MSRAPLEGRGGDIPSASTPCQAPVTANRKFSGSCQGREACTLPLTAPREFATHTRGGLTPRSRRQRTRRTAPAAKRRRLAPNSGNTERVRLPAPAASADRRAEGRRRAPSRWSALWRVVGSWTRSELPHWQRKHRLRATVAGGTAGNAAEGSGARQAAMRLAYKSREDAGQRRRGKQAPPENGR